VQDTAPCKPVRVRVATTWPPPPLRLAVASINVAAGKVSLAWAPVLHGDGADGGDAVKSYVVEARRAPPLAATTNAAAAALDDDDDDHHDGASSAAVVLVETQEELDALLHPPRPPPPPPPPPARVYIAREKVDAMWEGAWYHATVKAPPVWDAERATHVCRVVFEGFDDEQDVPLARLRPELFSSQRVTARVDGGAAVLAGEVFQTTPAGYYVKFKTARPMEDVACNDVVPDAEAPLPSPAVSTTPATPATPQDTASPATSGLAEWTVVYSGAKPACSLQLNLVRPHEARVAAVNGAHGQGQFSPAVALRPSQGSFIARPRDVSARAQRNVVMVDVPAVYDDAGVRATQFQVQVGRVQSIHALASGESGGGPCMREAWFVPTGLSDWPMRADSSESALVLEKLAPGTTVCVRVRARGLGSLVSAWSNLARVAVPAAAPAKVTDLALVEPARSGGGGGGGVVLARWTAPAANGSPLTGYVAMVRHAPRAGKPQGDFKRVDVGAVEAELLAGVAPGSRVEARVQAVNAMGAGPMSDVASILTRPELPGAPVVAKAAAMSATSIVVELGAPESTGGARAVGYELRVVDAAEHERVVPVADGGGGAGKPVVVAALKPASAYRVQARCVNEAGRGPWSVAAVEVRTRAPPAALKVPSALSATVEPAAVATERASVRLSWQCDDDASFAVELRHAGDKRASDVLAVSRASSTLLPAAMLPAGKEMSFRVQQVARAGGVASAFSEWCAFTAPPAAAATAELASGEVDVGQSPKGKTASREAMARVARLVDEHQRQATAAARAKKSGKPSAALAWLDKVLRRDVFRVLFATWGALVLACGVAALLLEDKEPVAKALPYGAASFLCFILQYVLRPVVVKEPAPQREPTPPREPLQQQQVAVATKPLTAKEKRRVRVNGESNGQQ